MQRFKYALLLIIISLSAYGNNLSLPEQKIVDAVKAHSGDAIQLLKRSANINSGTMNLAGVREVGELFRTEFNQLGFATQWADMPPAMQRAGHLIAERTGSQGKRVLLIGHLDTVFEKASTVPLWLRSGDIAHGQGVLDMKGGDVIIIAALRALHATGALDNTQIVVVMSGDEEHSGTPLDVARADLIRAAKRSDVALAFENLMRAENDNDTGTVGRRAIGSFTLNVTAKAGHSASVFGTNGNGAIYEMARILNNFREQVIEPGLTFNVGVALGGTEVSYNAQTNTGSAFGKKNVIPASALAEGDLRYLNPTQRDRAHARMQQIVSQSLAGAQAEIRFEELYPPMTPTKGNLQLLDSYSQASIDAGLGAIDALPPELRGAGDIQFVAPYVDSLDGLGAAGQGEHSPNEWVELASIEKATIRAALVIYRLTR